MNDQDYGWFGLLAAAAVGVGVGMLIGRAQQTQQLPDQPASRVPALSLGSVTTTPNGLPQEPQVSGQRSTQDLIAIAQSLPSGIEAEARIAQLGLSPGDLDRVRQFRLVNQRAMGAGGVGRVD